MSHVDDPIVISKRRDLQRIQCQMGHSSVDWTNNHWWCPMCAAHWDDVDAEYETVKDTKTGRELRREDIKFDLDDDSVPA